MAKKGRGSNTHGHGTHKRGAGRRGGRGFAGVKDQNWFRTLKGGKLGIFKGVKRGKFGHFGKYGFTRGGLKKELDVVNVGWLNERFSDGDTVDIRELGFEKLLGTGRLEKKLKIVAPAWSAKAEEKVKAAGGEIVKPE